MGREHTYKTHIKWTGNSGHGTTDATSYERSHTLIINHKPDILCSSDTPFRGDANKHNPEDFFLYSLAACHMLWYLHLCADHGIVVTSYTDDAVGTMVEKPAGGGHFTAVTLYPKVRITDETLIDKANALHEEAHKKCFIANSCNFPVVHEPVCTAIHHIL